MQLSQSLRQSRSDVPSLSLLQHEAAKKAAVALAVEDIETLLAGKRLPPRSQPNWAIMPTGGWNAMPPPDQVLGPSQAQLCRPQTILYPPLLNFCSDLSRT